jgi:MFS family permease
MPSLRRFVPPAGPQRRYVAITLIDALGSGLFTPVSVLFLTRIVGLSAVQVGGGLAVAGVVGLVATPIGGALADRYDPRILSASCFALAGLGFAVYPFVSSFAAFLVVASAIQGFERLERTGTKLIAVGIAGGEDRVRLLAYERSTRNAGYGLGGVLASLALIEGSRASYTAILLVNAASFGYGALNILRLPAPARTAAAREAGGYRVVLRDRLYVGLAGLNSFLWLNDSMLKVGIPLWLVRRTSVTPSVMGVLFTLNTAIVVALQVRASRGTSRVAGAARAYVRGGVSILAACVLFALAAGVPTALAVVLLIAAVCALTLAELFGSAAEWGVSIGLSTEELRGRYLGVFSTGSSLQQAAGPAIVTLALVHLGRGGWLLMGVALLAVAIALNRLALRGARRVPAAA